MFEGQEEMSNLYLFESIFVFFLKHLLSYEKPILMNKTDDEKKSIEKIIGGKMNY